jgi:Met-10+ like-protein
VIATLIRRVVPARFRPIGYLTHIVRERTGCQVRQGPFAAMCYVRDSIGSAYLPKLLGIYERELSPCVEAICAQQPSLIVDLGAGEGYYAVGLAKRIPSAQLIAFEMDPIGQHVVAKMAALNGVSERVEIRGKCEPRDLVDALGDEPQPVVVCDVEGYEDQLLDPTAIPVLLRSTILVEMHEFVIPGITDKIQARFADSHVIERIWQESRSRTDFPWRTIGTSLLPGSYLDWAVSEWRPERMSWLWMVPKN